MKATIIRRSPLYRKGWRNKLKGLQKNLLSVRFTDNKRKSWIGEFEMDSPNGLCQALAFDQLPYGLVVANGKGYVVNLEERKTEKELMSKNIVSVLKTNNPDLLIAGTEDEIFTVDTEGLIHKIVPDFNAKWFFLTKQTGRVVNGIIESDMNDYAQEIPFTVDLLDLELRVNI